jgi:hypothetical protein
MHRTRAADGGEAAAAAAAAEKVAPLLQLQRAAVRATEMMRLARALELYERAAAVADATLPRDSLVTAFCLGRAKNTCMNQACDSCDNPLAPDMMQVAWQRDERLPSLSRRCLMLYDARFCAGTLFTPTPEERAFFADDWMPAPLQGAVMFWTCAQEAAAFWPPVRVRAKEEARLHAIYDAVRAALEVVSRGLLHGGAAALAQVCVSPVATAAFFRANLLKFVLSDVGGDLLPETMRRVCALSRAEKAALYRMVDWGVSSDITSSESSRLLASLAERQQTAAADVARHGLRACALPDCAQTEPQPKAFKLCSRCRAVMYCSAVHQQQDWRRHQRADGCKATAEGQ